MSWKVTALLGFLLVVLVGFVLFYERPRMAAEQIDAEKGFLDVTRQTVAKFTLKNRHGTFVAEKRGNEWHIVEPVETPGDWERFESLVTAAREVERGRVIVDPEAYPNTDLTAFGLAPPRVELRFEDKSGEDIWLLLGDDNPVGRAAYLSWSGSNRVVLTQRSNRDRFDLKLLDLRDQRILPFDLDLVEKIELKHSGKTFEMVRNGFTWQIVRPGQYVGDGSEINNILGTVRAERIVNMVSETLTDSSRYGFDTPAYQFSVTNKAGDTRTLVLGKTVEDVRSRLWYAYNSERPYVFSVEPFMTDFLHIDMSDIRYKRVFEFDRQGIDRIQLAYSDSTITCVLDQGHWIVTKPDGYMTTDVAVGQWIDKVHTMAVSDFVGVPQNLAMYGLHAPHLRLSLWRNNTLVRQVQIGQGADGWYGKKDGSGEVYGFDSGVMSGLRLPMQQAPQSRIPAGAE